MGIAQNLKATHTVGENVRGVVDKVAAIDSKVAGVDERVAGVDDRVAGVGDRVASIDNTMKGVDAMVSSVDDRVRVVDDRVVEAIRGAYIIFNRSPKPYLYLIHSDGKEVKAATQQTATDVDQIKRLSSNLARVQTTEPYAYFQGTNCGKTFINGSPHQIPRRTITSHVVLITRKQHLGSFKAVSFRSGSQLGHFFGFTENVCPVFFST